MQLDYKKIKFDLSNPNFIMKIRTLPMEGRCSKTEVVEAFQDNLAKEAQKAGSIFCDTLNGEMISFPESIGQLVDLTNYLTKVMAKTNLDTIDVGVNAKSYSANLPKPSMGFSEGSLDIYDMSSDQQWNPTPEILDFLSLIWSTYQSREELCYIMTTSL